MSAKSFGSKDTSAKTSAKSSTKEIKEEKHDKSSTKETKEEKHDKSSAALKISAKDIKKEKHDKSSTKEIKEAKHDNKEEKHDNDDSKSVTSLGLPEEEEQEPFSPIQRLPSPVAVCRCLRDETPPEKSEIPARKLHILSTAERTESFLSERRIPELIRFLMTKLLSDAPEKPEAYIVQLLDDCMLYRAGLGQAPVLYERQHLEAVVKSFDPGSRGYLTSGQVRRIFTTLGLPPQDPLEEKTPTEEVLNELGSVQEKELYRLLTAGTDLGMKSNSANDSEGVKTT